MGKAPLCTGGLFCNLLLRGLLDYAEGDTSKDVAKETVTQLSPEIG